MSIVGLTASCASTSIDRLAVGMRPVEVRAMFGKPVQALLADRREAGGVRKMLIEEYPSGDGHRLQLIYTIPADLDELAMQGDLAWARRVAPGLLDGTPIAKLDNETRMLLNLRTARLLRYRRFAEVTDASR